MQRKLKEATGVTPAFSGHLVRDFSASPISLFCIPSAHGTARFFAQGIRDEQVGKECPSENNGFRSMVSRPDRNIHTVIQHGPKRAHGRAEQVEMGRETRLLFQPRKRDNK